jgi:hypothetical protein
MPNAIKYNVSAETLALKKGNFWIGTGDVGKGPTSSTGYYNGITPPSGGYTIYLNKETGGPSIYVASNDSQLISLTNTIANQSYTTANECLVYFAGQTDKLCVNRDYEGIITDGLVFNLDAGFTPSYPKNGDTWYGIRNTNNGSFTNGPTFNSSNGGNVVFDGVDDRIDFSTNILTGLQNTGISIDAWIYPISNLSSQQLIVGAWSQSATNDQVGLFIINSGPFIAVADGSTGESGFGGGTLSVNQWQYVVGTWNTNRTYKTYINGSLVATGTQTGNGYNTIGSSLFRVGGQAQGENRYFNGRISITRIYNKVLSDSEITQNFNTQKGRFGL